MTGILNFNDDGRNYLQESFDIDYIKYLQPDDEVICIAHDDKIFKFGEVYKVHRIDDDRLVFIDESVNGNIIIVGHYKNFERFYRIERSYNCGDKILYIGDTGSYGSFIKGEIYTVAPGSIVPLWISIVDDSNKSEFPSVKIIPKCNCIPLPKHYIGLNKGTPYPENASEITGDEVEMNNLYDPPETSKIVSTKTFHRINNGTYHNDDCLVINGSNPLGTIVSLQVYQVDLDADGIIELIDLLDQVRMAMENNEHVNV